MPLDMQNLVSTEWLAENLDEVRVLDASWFMPADDRDPSAEFLAAHIPGALFFNIDEIADTDSDLPHMLPAVEKFVSRVRRMGISNTDRVVVYDTAGVFSAPRVWWMFKVFGLADVAVLNGGMAAWLVERRAVETDVRAFEPSHFSAALDAGMVRDLAAVDAAREDVQVVDARSSERFRGEVAEPRVELRRGRIPGSLNVFFGDLVEGGQMKDAAVLRTIFEAAGVDIDAPTITTCGSGVTAAVLTLALAELGHTDNAIYDGSWTEWGGREDTEVAAG